MWKWIALLAASVAFAQDPPIAATPGSSPVCPATLARLNAADAARTKGNAPTPVPREEWDSFTIEVSDDRQSVFMFNNYPDDQGHIIQTTVNFVRSTDGLWHGNRVTLQDGKQIETRQWIQESIPYTRKTIADRHVERGPVTEEMLPPFARQVVNHLNISLADVEQARRELKAEAFSKKPVVWNPSVSLMDAITLTTVRLDPAQLLHAVVEGQAAFGYSTEQVIAQLQGREEFSDTTYDAVTSIYGHVVSSLAAMKAHRPNQEADRALEVILKSLR